MTIKEHLQARTNDWIAKQLWAQMSTELDNKTMAGVFKDEPERFAWILKRINELLSEYKLEDKRKAHGKEAED